MVAAPPPRVALVPNAIAFRDPRHGLLGTGWTSCDDPGVRCRPQGTISSTSDGGRTWRVVLRTMRPVVDVDMSGGTETAVLDDGENLASADGGRSWRRAVVGSGAVAPPCPAGNVYHLVETPGGRAWALCATQGSAGSMGKSVYRRGPTDWRRVAYTPFAPPGPGYGGISLYGYPAGIAMADDGFGVIWETRGTLWITRDGGSHWEGLPKIAQPELDFGYSAAALPRGIAYVILAREGTEVRRLIVTHDAGRTWRAVHRWR